MLFNSLEFIGFFALVFWGYFALPSSWKYLFLLAASYLFYASWNPMYTFLIVGSTLVDYFAAIHLEKATTQQKKKLFLTLSLASNLGLLGFLKYFGFFSGEANQLLASFGWDFRFPLTSFLLPVGISFYTFQTMSYTIDVYRGDRKAERHLGHFALFVTFFPQLVAGPIERSTSLLPQLKNLQDFDYVRVRDGFQLILWGLYKKIVVADWLADYVNAVYGSPTSYGGVPSLLATFFFAFQIYFDFSAYSEIARGCAKVFGVDLMVNFRTPYFSTSIKEFWQRWHISLSTWFRDYVYFPLGGNRVSFPRMQMNLLIVFLVSGIWHGANWTFIIWGLLHGIALVAFVLFTPLRKIFFDFLRLESGSTARNLLGMAFTFTFVVITWVFFRADSLADAGQIFSNFTRFFPLQLGGGQLAAGMSRGTFLFLFLGISSVVFLEAKDRIFRVFASDSLGVRWTAYIILTALLVTAGHFQPSEFVYFQF